MSATVDLAEVLERSSGGRPATPSRLRYLIIGLSVALIAALGAVFYFTAQQPREPSPLNFQKRQPGPVPMSQTSELPGAALKKEVIPDRFEAKKVPAGEKEKQPTPEGAVEVGGEGQEVLVPAHFRLESTVFWFRNEWDENRFLKRIRAIPAERRITLVGHPTEIEARTGNDRIGISRAWAVRKYLEKKGFGRERVTAVKGKPVPVEADLDKSGRPQNRWVGFIVE